MSPKLHPLRKPASLEEFQSVLAEADPHDSDLFRDIISAGVDLLSLPLKALADEFGVSPASITRWRQGKNAPHPTVRKLMYRWMSKRIATVLLRKPAVAAQQSNSWNASKGEDFARGRAASDAVRDQRINASTAEVAVKGTFPVDTTPVMTEAGLAASWSNHASKTPSWHSKTPGLKAPNSTTPSGRKAAA
jgi:transcriptional regulator with XRE-family HTH domain